MNVTAADILVAIRKKHWGDAVVREVVIDDPIEAAIRRRYYVDRWPAYGKRYLDQGLPIADAMPEGWGLSRTPPRRRIDALIMSGKDTTAVEIKVTRADFRRETPEKRRAWLAVVNRFVYAAPVGIIPRDEIPDGCGLWEFNPAQAGPWHFQHGMTAVVRARRNKTPDPLPRQVLVSLAYRVSNQERVA